MQELLGYLISQGQPVLSHTHFCQKNFCLNFNIQCHQGATDFLQSDLSYERYEPRISLSNPTLNTSSRPSRFVASWKRQLWFALQPPCALATEGFTCPIIRASISGTNIQWSVATPVRVSLFSRRHTHILFIGPQQVGHMTNLPISSSHLSRPGKNQRSSFGPVLVLFHRLFAIDADERTVSMRTFAYSNPKPKMPQMRSDTVFNVQDGEAQIGPRQVSWGCGPRPTSNTFKSS